MYQSLTGPMLQQTLKQIEAMGVETVQQLATIVIAPFLTEWNPIVPFSNPRDCNSSRFSFMTLWKIFKNISYLWLPVNRLDWWSRCQDERRST